MKGNIKKLAVFVIIAAAKEDIMGTARWLFVVVSVLLVASLGCASAPPKESTVDVTGTWEGMWTCKACHPTKNQGVMSLKLSQAGPTVSGKMSSAGAPDDEITGSFSGGMLNFSRPGAGTGDLEHHGPVVNAVLSVSGRDMYGNGVSGANPVSITLRRNP